MGLGQKLKKALRKIGKKIQSLRRVGHHEPRVIQVMPRGDIDVLPPEHFVEMDRTALPKSPSPDEPNPFEKAVIKSLKKRTKQALEKRR